MIKKSTSILAAFALVTMFAFAGCQQREQKGGQMPEKSAPTSSPSTTPATPGGK